METFLLPLDDERATDARLVGNKAARLAMLHRSGLPVPQAYVLTVEAYRHRSSTGWQAPLLAAYRELSARGNAVAVRSSATQEDLAAGSLAGLQATVLGVRDRSTLLAAVKQVWNSLEGEPARAYRARLGLAGGAMGVLVQTQVQATAAGVAFSRDPMTGDPLMVVEAVPGIADRLVTGVEEPQQWRVDRDTVHVFGPTRVERSPLLTEDQLRDLAALVGRAVDYFGEDQDVEWAYDGQQFWLLQTRPVTVSGEDWFTDRSPDDHALWTAAFLNERFTQPVSPLGWTLVAEFVERLALRAPLELLGMQGPEGRLLKLWRGHPYSRVEAWQRIYKLFPDWLLPEDAARYFPDGDLTLRRAPVEPVLGLDLVRNGLRLLVNNFQAVSPFHNPRAWRRYERRHRIALERFHQWEQSLLAHRDPIPASRRLLREVHNLTGKLLELHRWSLLYAELSYSLLRRLLTFRHGPVEGTARAARIAASVRSPTSRSNRELEALAGQVAQNDDVHACLLRLAEGDVTVLDHVPKTSQLADFLRAFEQFMEAYGHRFFSLDIYDPPWEADLPGFARFLLTLLPGATKVEPSPTQTQVREPIWLHPFIRLTQAYLRLREVQRFHWQQLLALERRVIIQMGYHWVLEGRLAESAAIFGLTWRELMEEEPDGVRAAARIARLHRLREQAMQTPGWHYPDFLRGNRPMRSESRGSVLTGRPASPGLVQGAARLVAHPGDFDRLQPGDVLVTTSPDPGWTPVFGTVAALVTERGGQLSHGAVVAREYALPAVFGVPGIMSLLREGESLLVDGRQGKVIRLGKEKPGNEGSH